MSQREYRTVPLPALRTRRSRDPGERVAEVMQDTINGMAAQGWRYLRAETIRAMEAQGLMRGREEVSYTVLVFERDVDGAELDARERGARQAVEPAALEMRDLAGAPSRDAAPARARRQRTLEGPEPFEDDAEDGALARSDRRPPLGGSRRGEERFDRSEPSAAPAQRSRLRGADMSTRGEGDERSARPRDDREERPPLRRRSQSPADLSEGMGGGDGAPRAESGFIARTPRPDRFRR